MPLFFPHVAPLSLHAVQTIPSPIPVPFSFLFQKIYYCRKPIISLSCEGQEVNGVSTHLPAIIGTRCEQYFSVRSSARTGLLLSFSTLICMLFLIPGITRVEWSKIALLMLVGCCFSRNACCRKRQKTSKTLVSCYPVLISPSWPHDMTYNYFTEPDVIKTKKRQSKQSQRLVMCVSLAV